MIETIKRNFLLIATAVVLGFAAFVPATASAGNVDINKNLDCGSNIDLQQNGCNQNISGGTTTIQNTIRTIINIFSVIVGAVAVIMIIFGGFRYITSGGDSNNIGSAKNTILFAIVGLVIVAVAQAIVQFVLSEAV